MYRIVSYRIKRPLVFPKLNEKKEFNEKKEKLKIFFDELRNSMKYKNYQYLKNRGFYISTGLKYGADFLVYNGKINFFGLF